VRIDVQVHTHRNKEYEDADGREIWPYGQGHVYSNKYIYVCLISKRCL